MKNTLSTKIINLCFNCVEGQESEVGGIRAGGRREAGEKEAGSENHARAVGGRKMKSIKFLMTFLSLSIKLSKIRTKQ